MEKVANYEGEERSEIYHLQSIMSEGLKVLETTKSDYTSKFSDELDIIASKANEYLINHGMKMEFEFSNESYVNIINKLDADFNKYMFLSHAISENNKLWEAHIEKINKNYKSSLVDHVTSTSETNDYFTAGKQRVIDQYLFQYSTFLYYWINDDKRLKTLFNLIGKMIEIIYSSLEITYETRKVKNDIEALKQAIISLSNEVESGYYQHVALFYIISLLEKILRKIYCKLNKEGYFLKTSVTLGVLIGNKNNKPNEKMLSLIGKHQIKWLKFYLSNADKNLGNNLRNKIAHYRNIEVGDLSSPQVMKIFWLFISTINSIMVNLVNHFEFESENL